MQNTVNLKLVLSYLLTLFPILVYGQYGKLFSADMELPNSTINCVYQDQNDMIWIATEDGLSKYDGSKFTTYKHIRGDKNSLNHNYIRTLFEDSKGHFFIGLLNGLQLYDYAKDIFEEILLINEKGEKFYAHVFMYLGMSEWRDINCNGWAWIIQIEV